MAQPSEANIALQVAAAPSQASTEMARFASQPDEAALPADAENAAGAEAGAPVLSYRAYEAPTATWQGWKAAKGKAGKQQVQAVQMKLDAGGYAGAIAYKVRIKGSGWSKGWVSDGAAAGKAGKAGKARAITGLKVKLTGQVAQVFDVLYRVRDQKEGWRAWTFNGRTAATRYGLASFWVTLKRRGTAKNVAEGAYYLTSASDPAVVLEDPKASAAKHVQMRSASAKRTAAQRFYLRHEGGGLVSLQAVASGLFLAGIDGKAVQLADSPAASQRWKTVWNDGFVLVNEATGEVLSLGGDTVRKGAAATVREDAALAVQRWTFAKAKLVAGGYYRLKSAVGTYLDIADGSYAYGANVQARSRNSSGAQVFRVRTMRGGNVRIESCRSFLAVGVERASAANRANAVQEAKSASRSQLWKPALDRSGAFVLANAKSGKVLEVAGSSKASGANVRQGKASGARGQQWRLVEAKRYSLSGNASLDHSVARVLRTHSTLRSAFNWTVAHPYREGQRYYSNPRVLPDSRTVELAGDFFKHGSGNCYRFAAAFSWLARGLDYRTRVISGWVQAASGGRAPHGWVEVVLNGVTYVCDPDLQHEIPSYNWFMRTYATSPTAYHSW